MYRVECQLNYKGHSFSLLKVVSLTFREERRESSIFLSHRGGFGELLPLWDPGGSPHRVRISLRPPYLLPVDHRGCGTEGFRLHCDRRDRRTSRGGGRRGQWWSEAGWPQHLCGDSQSGCLCQVRAAQHLPTGQSHLPPCLLNASVSWRPVCSHEHATSLLYIMGLTNSLIPDPATRTGCPSPLMMNFLRNG